MDDALFYRAQEIAELIAQQGVQAIDSIDAFAGAIPDEDLKEFVNGIYADRVASRQ